MQTWHSHRTFVGIRLPPSESRITGGNIKISNVLKISPRLRAVPLGLRYQGIGSSINFSVSFSSKRNGSGWPQKVIDKSLPAAAPSAHSGLFDKASNNRLLFYYFNVFRF